MYTIHSRLTVLVTGQAGETGVVVRILVALGAVIPCPPVRARINGEKLAIVNGKIGRFPSWQGSMAFQAVGGDPGRNVVRICGTGIIILVARIAFC